MSAPVRTIVSEPPIPTWVRRSIFLMGAPVIVGALPYIAGGQGAKAAFLLVVGVAMTVWGRRG